MDTKNLTIQDIEQGIEKKEFSYKELFDSHLSLIKKDNPEINSFLSVFENDEKQKTGELTGIPCAIKDNILIDGKRTTAGSKILENYVASYDATVIQRLKKAGAVFLGKTNMDEFAMGSSTENSAFGPTKNPIDPTRVPGGSSGGSCASVASGMSVFALGSDTGGSIRQPASFCGVVGLKPTYGLVSRFGLIALASSLDQIGPITKNVYDSARVLNVIAGHDKNDSTTVKVDVPDYTKSLGQDIKGMKIGMPEQYFGQGLDEEVKKIVVQTVSKLEKLGAKIEEISLPHSEYALAVYYIILPSEVSANLARFDGIRYGYSDKQAANLLDVYMDSRGFGFGDEVKRRIMLGTYALSAGYYDAYYKKAQQVRTLIKQDFEKAFEKVDLIVGPTTPTVAFKFGEKINDPLSMYLSDIYTVAVNLAGLPAISLPCGTISKDNIDLPVGFQIIGKHFDEQNIFKLAYCVEKNK